MRLFPRTLLWRAFVLIAALILLSVAAWFQVFRFSEREPRARQTAQMVVSVVNLTRALAAEWGRHNVNVNAICPGFFPSKMSQGILDRIAPHIVARTPLGRLGGDEDLKGAVVFLASEASRHVTGQCLTVDGGAIVT